MTIGRVKGPLLQSDLDRQGVDLQFTTDDHTLLYLDFANFKVSINGNTTNKDETFTVDGNALIDGVKIDGTTISSASNLSLSPVGNILLGDVSKVKIGGGQLGYMLTTDGNNNVSWGDINSIGASLSLNGMNVVLSVPTDSSLVDNAAYRYWTANTTVTNAVDNLNQVMLNVYQNTFVGHVDFTATVVAGNSPLTVQFTPSITGNPNSYFWDFGDGTSSVLRNPTHTYTNSGGGQYSVYFKAYNTNGTLGGTGVNGSGAQGSYHDITKLNYITLYAQVPVPSFTLDKHQLDSGSVVMLTNTSLNGVSYEINWGDGSVSAISTNSASGGITGGPISHLYLNTVDSYYDITLTAINPAAGSSNSVTSTPQRVYVYIPQLPTFSLTPDSGINQHAISPFGLHVSFLNSTVTSIGSSAIFSTNSIRWVWGDGSITTVTPGLTIPGDVNIPITHAYTLSDPTVPQTFTVSMQIISGHSLSPFTSVTRQVTVTPASTAAFIGRAAILSDRIGDSPQVGYNFIDLTGANRGLMTFTNSSLNTDTYQWTYGDSNVSSVITEGSVGSVIGGPISHLYTTVSNYSVSLHAYGPLSISPTDDTLVKSNYITILPAPPPPANLGTKVLSMVSVGNNPAVAANYTNNSSAPNPAAGLPVVRVMSSSPMIATNLITDAYNASSGTLIATVNGNIEPPVVLTGSNDTGTYGSLVITADKDAHLINSSVYPSKFYNVFSGKLESASSSVPVGFNTYQLTHSVEGSTNILGFIKDNLISVPTVSVASASATAINNSSIKFVSGVPYFTVGGIVEIAGISVYNWIGQTYANVSSPLTVSSSTILSGSGPIITAQGKSYTVMSNVANSFMVSGVPKANTGASIGAPYTLGAISVDVDANASASGKISFVLTNVNGNSAPMEYPTPINTLSSIMYGFDEFNIPVSPTLGLTYTSNGKRVSIQGANGDSPVYQSNVDYYTNHLLNGMLPVGSDDAIVKLGVLVHDNTDYSVQLPPGPNLSTRTGPQFLRFAFKRTIVANFTVTYSGKISGLKISAPGTQIDASSSNNGWVDATLVYAGAGIPGENTALGGNGSNGCAKSAGDVLPVGQNVVGHSIKLTLGSENSSNSYANQILVSVMLSAGDFLTNISIS